MVELGRGRSLEEVPVEDHLDVMVLKRFFYL